MSVGFVMLAHKSLDRAAEVARHLAAQDAPVAVHVDRRTDDAEYAVMCDQTADAPLVRMVPRIASSWGTWGLVEATLAGCRQIMADSPDLTHIYLVSGSCLPLCSVADIEAHLADHGDADLIESVSIEDVPWAVEGLEKERFTLTFPVSWKRHRRVFDAWVRLQRAVGRNRKPPPGLLPHMGSQWWCLSTDTLRRILNDPDLPRAVRFFRKVWIPDESFFQTMVRRHSDKLVSQSPTLAHFGFRGRPRMFYDDHLPVLLSSDALFARKIWHEAHELYDHFLGAGAGRLAAAPDIRVAQELTRAADRRSRGRPGLISAGRLPKEWADTVPSAAPFTVLYGFEELFPGIRTWLADTLKDTAHGRLFGPGPAKFATGEQVYMGGLSSAPTLRDHDPVAFLRNLIWSTRGTRQSFLMSAGDAPGLMAAMARDPHAEIWMITGCWALTLDTRDGTAFRTSAARLQRAEIAALSRFRERWTRARVRVWSLADCLADPAQPLQALLEHRMGQDGARLLHMPELVMPPDVLDRLARLRDAGLTVHLAGDVADVLSPRTHGTPTLRSVH